MQLLSIDPHNIPKTGDDRPVATLFRYVIRMSGNHQVWVCLVAACVALLTMAPLELQRRLVNDVIVAGDMELLLLLGSLYLAVLVVQGLMKVALRLYQSWLSESAIRYNRLHLSRVYERRTAENDEESGGRAVSIIGAEIDRLGGFVGEGFSQPVVNIGILLSVGGFMLVVEPFIAAVSLVFLVPQVILVPWFQSWINRLLERRLGLMRDLSDTISELSSDGSEIGDTQLPKQVDDIYRNRIKLLFVKFGTKGITNFLNALGPLCVLVFGGVMVIQGETTIGTIVAFVSGFDRLSNPLREMISYYRVAAQANVQHKMIAKWIT
ncbi:ABC transporter transmembrane domain-containing protein [Denitrobaculum tricleocarpae]|uniref:ABC transporter ATP-binding protein n=1 Tax=Denitrobaculum tricleocarpae TaxID=2591009 RepID=A0A545SYN9_9PROT|nr:ABC transporter ATP-binding protein [Denitrobaculum tricleocarpae]TQV70083.1 ABC transporter ATP-binding protein [Denitrobaculum tricleocarpae]